MASFIRQGTLARALTLTQGRTNALIVAYLFNMEIRGRHFIELHRVITLCDVMDESPRFFFSRKDGLPGFAMQTCPSIWSRRHGNCCRIHVCGCIITGRVNSGTLVITKYYYRILLYGC